MKSVLFAGSILVVQAVLLVGMGEKTGPNVDEIAHLASGLYHWQTGRMDAYRVNPPLVRLWCSLPIAITEPQLSWTQPPIDPRARHEWQLDDQLMTAWTYEELDAKLRIARAMNVVFAMIGSVACWRFAARCGGEMAGYAAMLLYAFSPNLLAWHATICPDAAAAALAIAATFWQNRLLVEPDSRTPRCAFATGLWTGLAILAKSTCLLLLPLLWLGSLFAQAATTRGGDTEVRFAASSQRRMTYRRAAFVASIVAIWAVHVGYGFAGSGVRLAELHFQSQGLQKLNNLLLAAPLPRDFLLGIDCQLREFEDGKRSYLGGHWQERGWPTYYVACLLLKLPVATLLLLAVSLSTSAFRFAEQRLRPPELRGTPNAIGQLTVKRWPLYLAVVPLFLFLGVASSQTGFSHHFRYAMPCLPFLFVLASQACQGHPSRLKNACPDQSVMSRQSSCGQLVASVLVLCSISSSLLQWPSSHSFFSESIGGGRNGYLWLLESNLDWGEDLKLAAKWAKAHPEARPLYHGTVATSIAEYMPCDWTPMPSMRQPGWYLISIQRELDPHDACYRRFSQNQFVARIGDSMRVYRVLPASDASFKSCERRISDICRTLHQAMDTDTLSPLAGRHSDLRTNRANRHENKESSNDARYLAANRHRFDDCFDVRARDRRGAHWCSECSDADR